MFHTGFSPEGETSRVVMVTGPVSNWLIVFKLDLIGLIVFKRVEGCR